MLKRIGAVAIAGLFVLGACGDDEVSRDELKSELRKELANQQIGSDEQVDCVVDALDELSDDDLEKIADGGEPSADAVDAFTGAVAECVLKG